MKIPPRRVWLSLVIALLGTGLALCLGREVRASPAPPVETKVGLLQGSIEGGLTVYRGVPYAVPPVGDLRWRTPQRMPRWRGVRSAERFSAACMQLGPTFPGMPAERVDEDCLYLNLWVPRGDDLARPVMVFLHGGGMRNGSASTPLYDGSRLAARGVIVISANYRLGALGFLAHPKLSREQEGASGNYALMDIAAALGWVNDNIAAFGGDPANVTVFGQSAGSWAISRLVTSPLAKGLFVRAIGESSADFAVTTPLSEAEAAGLRLAAAVGAHSLAELRRMPARRIVEVPADQWPVSPRGYTSMATRDGRVLQGDVAARYLTGSTGAMNLILGYTSEEGVNLLGKLLGAKDWRERLRTRGGPFARRLLETYPADDDAVAARSQARFAGEFQIKWHMAKWARAHRDAGKGDVYFYRFSHVMPFGPQPSAGHGAELGYVFDFPPRALRYTVQSPLKARADSAMVDLVQAYWINFARSGNPNGPGLPDWPSFTKTGMIMEFGEEGATAKPWQDEAEHALMDDYMDWLKDQGPGASAPLP